MAAGLANNRERRVPCHEAPPRLLVAFFETALFFYLITQHNIEFIYRQIKMTKTLSFQ